MARFDDNWLNELYSKNDIVDVVSSYTTLTERGGRHWGLCPFHNEKTPSFSVSQDKQLYYCFGCKQGGNVANFIMKTENMTFGEAIEMLAKRVHMEMPQEINDDQYREIKKKKQTINEMNKMAAKMYHDALFSSAGKDALSYLKKRGIEQNVIKRFGMGYAPESWDFVLKALRKKGYPEDIIKQSGLVTVKNNNMFDTFRNRVMFPIINTFGDVIAFGGRVMGDGTPKYLNTKDTIVFNKRKNLYAIDQIRKMRDIKSVVIVEGYMDVVSLCANGVKSAVASLGTALTKEQAVLIKRYTDNVFIAYDGDEAGQIATMKALKILSAEGLNVRVIRFEEGMDPDDYIKKYGLAGFAQKVKKSYTAVAYKLDVKKREFDLNTEDGKESYAIAAAGILSAIDSPIKRERYTELVRKQTGYSKEAIEAQMGKKKSSKNSFGNNRYNSTNNDEDSIETAFLACAMANPQYVVDVEKCISVDSFSDITHKNIFSELYEIVKRGIQPTYAELLSELDSEAERSEAARLSGMEIEVHDPLGYMQDCASKMHANRLATRRKQLLQLLRSASGEEKRNLLAEIDKLDKELREKRLG